MFKKTKEKINKNQYMIFIKKMWGNKRYRSLLILALYFIFFFVVITGLRSTYQDNENINNHEEDNYFSFENLKKEYNNLRDYSYKIFVNDELLVNGKLENAINNFEYGNDKYTIINNSLYKEEDGDLKKIELTNENIILTIVDKLMLSNLIDYVSNINKSGVTNVNSFALDFEVPNSYFSLEENKFVNVRIIGNTITKVDEIIVDLMEYKQEEYIIKVKVSDIND